MDEQSKTRAKILGVLIQDARRHAGRSVEQCARVLKVTPEAVTRAEQGERVASLPELEALAIYLDVPMAHFWGTHTLGDVDEPNYGAMLALRHKIVGGLLRQARLNAGKSVEEVAKLIGEEQTTIEAYESGEEEIPFLQLDDMARFLDVSIDYFLDGEQGPLGQHEARQKMLRRFHELPPDVQEFVVEPVNINYLKTAMRLSEMDAEQLRNLAAGILEITY